MRTVIALSLMLAVVVPAQPAFAAEDDDGWVVSATAHQTCYGSFCALTIACSAIAPGPAVETTATVCVDRTSGTTAPIVSNPGNVVATTATATDIIATPGQDDSAEVCFTFHARYPLLITDSISGCQEITLGPPNPTGEFEAGDSNTCEAESCVEGSGRLLDVVTDKGGPRGAVVVFDCSGLAPNAHAVSITRCTANQHEAPQNGASGPAAETAGAATVREPATVYEVCWTVTALFTSNSVTTSGCGEVTVAI
jgi:hypothetical protein